MLFRYTSCIFLIFLLSAAWVAAQSLSAQQRKAAEDAAINNIIFHARSQTPEIAADALITIAESDRLASRPSLKRRILTEAFDLASQAQHPVRIRYMGNTDNPVNFRYEPLQLKIDGLALRSRVVRAFLKFDKSRARKLFLDEIPPNLDLPPLGCEDAVRYYDVNDYYTTALAVFTEAFSAKERSEQGFLFTALPLIEGMKSPAQVDAAAKMLAGLKLKPVTALVTCNFVDASRGQGL